MAGRISQRIPAFAVVAGCDLNGLGVARSLGAAKVPLVVLDTDLSKATLATRFGKKIAVRSLSGPDFVDELLRIRSRFTGNPILILTQEASVATLAEAHDLLEGVYRLTIPHPRLTQDLLDKQRFQLLAERHGLPIPRAMRVTKESGSKGTETLRFPCVLKPTTKSAKYDTKFAKAYKVTSATEVESLWAGMRGVVGDIIVQEWIEGGDSDVYFCLQYRGRGLAPTSFVGRKTCQWPPLIGGTATCMPAPEAAAELIKLTNRFFDAVDLVGLCSMEFKRDVRNGKFYAVEPTVGRTDYQEEIAWLNGVNIPLAAYCGELGMPAPVARNVAPPRAWRDPFGYANAKRRGAADSLNDLSREIRICDAYFRFNDPMPYLKLKAQTIRRKIRWLR